MPLPASPLYLLDTNILVHAVRGRATWNRIKAACDPLMAEPRPVYSMVTEAELLSFVEQQSWPERKREQAAFLLGYFGRITLDDPNILRAYVLLDAYSRRLPGGSVKMGKNDLWIAATAKALGAVIVTTDRDFEHLNGTMLSRLLVV
jgi:tRNA(fMet)-specific endonuclease VapC